MSARKEKKSSVKRWTIVICCSLLLALGIRYFLLESFRMPSSQMENTILAGDFIWVNKTAYGIKMPMITARVFPEIWKTPSTIRWPQPVERNDIVVYKTTSGVMISRCLGLPGDTLEVKAHDYYINGEMLLQSPQVILPYQYPLSSDAEVNVAMKDLRIPFRDSFDENGKKVRFFSKYEYYSLTDALDSLALECYEKDAKDYKVCIPDGQYWMLSDNVNASAESRHFGLIDHTNLIGRAWLIWFSKDPSQPFWKGYRGKRFFRKISR
jgi:signal peptidase I